MKGTQEGFLSRQINPPRRKIAANGRNLLQHVEKPNGFFDMLKRPAAYCGGPLLPQMSDKKERV